MAVASTERNRAPRGSKSITQAFFAALESIPEARRAEVAKASLGAIKDEMKMRVLKAKASRVAAKARKPAPVARKSAKPAVRAKPRAMSRRSSSAVATV